tara:strand:+ start:48 stop:464 length:417 start_codon:yes stop_codon:yes gene_type:complete
MGYIGWSFIALAAYGVTTILLKLALRNIPPEAAAAITNTMLVGSAVVYAVYRGINIPQQLSQGVSTVYLLLAGVTLSVGIISFYIALSRGPASVVAPIFGMNLALVSIMGFILLGEPVNTTRVLGVALAAVAIMLLTR